MKKFLSFAFALLLSISVSAQTTLIEAVNFKATAHEGEEIDLFGILDQGKYVLINFFYSGMPIEDKAVVPTLVDAYYSLGCNESDIYFMEVSPTDTDASYSIGTWLTQYNIPYPTIHTKTGGDTGDKIDEMYDIQSYPTTILIAPDRSIKLNNYKPESVSAMVEYLTTEFDIEENYCSNQTPEVTVVTTKVNKEDGQGTPLEASTKVHVDFRANASTVSFYYMISESAELTSEEVITNGTKTEEKEFSYTFEGLTESTTYYVYTQAIGSGETNGNKNVLQTRTLCPGDEGDVEITVDVNITASYVVATAVPNESTSEFHFGFSKKEFYDESEINQFTFLNSLVNDDYPLCEDATFSVSIDSIPGNIPYYVVAIGRNGEGEWFAPFKKEFVVEKAVGPAEVTLVVKSVTDTEATIIASPNEYAVEFHYAVVLKSVLESVGEESLVEQVRNDGNPAYEEEAGTWNNLTPQTEYVCLASGKNSNGEWGQTAKITFTTGAESLSELEAGFEIFPNPATSMINIKSSLNGEAQVNIFDMTGRCVKQVVTDMNNATISIENLNKGVYFISVQQDKYYNIQKLVVE